MKTKRKRKWKIPHAVLERQTLCFSSYKNRKLKVKLWRAEARKRKKRAFFVLFILSEGNFFKICVLSQCVAYWIHFQNIQTFIYQKHYFICCLFLKSLKTFSVSLRFVQACSEFPCLLLIAANQMQLTIFYLQRFQNLFA